MEDGGANSLTFSLYACRSRPATAGEAADGRTLINALTIPMQHTLTGADPLVLKLTSFLNAVIPLLLAADQATRFLALVVTTVYSTSLLAALDVERPEGQ